MQTYIIYHKSTETSDCPDGIISCAIAYSAIGDDQTQVMGDTYRHINEYPPLPEPHKYPFTPGSRIVIVDFSYPKSWLEYWQNELGIDLTIIDHHAAKFPMLEGFSKAILNERECGATLTWKHFYPFDSLPNILVDVRRRDIEQDGYYDGLIRYSEALNEGLGEWRYSFPLDDKLQLVKALGRLIVGCSKDYEFERGVYDSLVPIGEARLKERDRIIAAGIPRAELRTLTANEQDYLVPYIKLEGREEDYYSMFGSILARKFSDSPFAWIETTKGHSLRSTGFDTRPISKYFGGGGHPKASSFRTLEPAQ